VTVQEGPLIIRIGLQGDGCVYRMDWRSKERLNVAHPRAHVVPTVLIGYAKRDEFEKLQAPMWPQIAQLIAGVDLEKLKALGGVELYNPEGGWRRRILEAS